MTIEEFYRQCRAIGIPNTLHGGKRRRKLMIVALELLRGVIPKGSAPFERACKKTHGWIYIGSRAATIGCVRMACYKTFAICDRRERAALVLLLFAADWNAGYLYQTAYDEAFWDAIEVLELTDVKT